MRWGEDQLLGRRGDGGGPRTPQVHALLLLVVEICKSVQQLISHQGPARRNEGRKEKGKGSKSTDRQTVGGSVLGQGQGQGQASYQQIGPAPSTSDGPQGSWPCELQTAKISSKARYAERAPQSACLPRGALVPPETDPPTGNNPLRPPPRPDRDSSS